MKKIVEIIARFSHKHFAFHVSISVLSLTYIICYIITTLLNISIPYRYIADTILSACFVLWFLSRSLFWICVITSNAYWKTVIYGDIS